jgi:hypothetical protein
MVDIPIDSEQYRKMMLGSLTPSPPTQTDSFQGTPLQRRDIPALPPPPTQTDVFQGTPLQSGEMPTVDSPEGGFSPENPNVLANQKIDAMLTPLQKQYQQTLMNVPPEYHPTIKRRILAGIGGALGGYGVGKDILMAPQTQQMQQYQMQTGALGQAAGMQQQSVINRSQQALELAKTQAEQARREAEVSRKDLNMFRMSPQGQATTGANLRPLSYDDPENPGNPIMGNYNPKLGTVTPIPGVKPPERPKEGAIPGEILASVGPRPKAVDYEDGINGMPFRQAMKTWGDSVEKVRLNRLRVAAQARGQAYGAFRPTPVMTVDDEGNIRETLDYAGHAIATGASLGNQAGAARIAAPQATIGTIRNSLQMLKQYSPALDKEGIRIKALMAEPGWLGGTFAQSPTFNSLSEEGQNFVIHLYNAQEQLQNLRIAGGAGTSSDATRKRILQNLPNVSTPNSNVANRLIDRQLLDVNLLEKGIPNVGQRAGGPTPATGQMVKMKAPSGQVKEVPANQVEHYKSLGAQVVK